LHLQFGKVDKIKVKITGKIKEKKETVRIKEIFPSRH
jgi:hypothetical protein